MENLSRSYVDAVAAYVGAQVARHPVDNHSVDGTIVSSAGNCPRIDFQLKSTYAHRFNGNTLTYPLPVKNYNALISERCTPIILILLVMPEREDEWLDHQEEALAIRNCAYWASLNGAAATDNTATINVSISRTSVLSPDELSRLLEIVSRGGAL